MGRLNGLLKNRACQLELLHLVKHTTCLPPCITKAVIDMFDFEHHSYVSVDRFLQELLSIITNPDGLTWDHNGNITYVFIVELALHQTTRSQRAQTCVLSRNIFVHTWILICCNIWVEIVLHFLTTVVTYFNQCRDYCTSLANRGVSLSPLPKYFNH